MSSELNLPFNTGDMSLNPGQATEIPHVLEQLSSPAAITEAHIHSQDPAQPNK